MVDRAQSGESGAELVHDTYYTPEELNDLFGVGLDVIRRAAYDGQLPADMVGNDIVGIKRADALAWLERRETEEGPIAGDDAVP